MPYVLLLHPETGRAAAYTNNHRLVTPLASEKLVAFALAHTENRQPWDESKYEPESPWRPLPDWATPDVRASCVLLWIARGNADDAYWRSIPKR